MRGRKKGKSTRQNKYWSKEEKLRIVKRVLNHENSLSKISTEEKINPGQLHSWVKKYLTDGEDALINKKKPGIPYEGLHLRKELTDLEKLQYENMKLKVENERLKKGYYMEGDGQTVVFNNSNKKSLK